ncbi:hypothetical protein ANCCAN_11278 [Ancylostoma caninum]|uniref:EF-hand domain-containing protein n=1 Tax=Ancylostoma caninum TaxID=29170 RepID=A0A368GI44_ANCCA|nr:hypothetical protein ANCCAN_11278 [Ancylostoma caninum]
MYDNILYFRNRWLDFTCLAGTPVTFMTCKHLDGNGKNFDLGLPAVMVPVLALVLATSFHSQVTRVEVLDFLMFDEDDNGRLDKDEFLLDKSPNTVYTWHFCRKRQPVGIYEGIALIYCHFRVYVGVEPECVLNLAAA